MAKTKRLQDLVNLGDVILDAEVVAGETEGWTIPIVRVIRENTIRTLLRGETTIGVDRAVSEINMAGNSIGMKPGTFQIRIDVSVPFGCRG